MEDKMNDPQQAPEDSTNDPQTGSQRQEQPAGEKKRRGGPGRPPGSLNKFRSHRRKDTPGLEYDPLEDRLNCRTPQSSGGLRSWIWERLGVRIPHRRVCPHHDTPLDYLKASVLDQQDLLVWANRGGGKTFLAAIATLLDAMLHRPIKICVLGGSFDQSDRLADYVRNLLEAHPRLVQGRMTRERVRLATGSEIEMLAQSQKAVRGQHVQKFRCDEVDLFDSGVWRALQFATSSQARTRGSIEVLSTLHRSGGLMQRLVDEARENGVAGLPPQKPLGPRKKRRGQDAPARGYRLIQWCLWEVIERCHTWRKCDRCPLWEDCRGVARRGDGFFRIDDAIRIQARSSRSAWESEMLCRGVRRDHLVLREFSPARHVAPVEYDPELPLYRAIDFGYRSPMVCLWVQVAAGGSVRVIQEYVQPRRALEQHAIAIRAMDPGRVVASFADPAGRAHESTSGTSCVGQLASFGIPCQTSASTISEGLELVRGALDPAEGGQAMLQINPRCRRLIESLANYHYPPPESGGDPNAPVKDGPDHCIDALRYFFIGHARIGQTKFGSYLYRSYRF